jgi:hypothetical protein
MVEALGDEHDADEQQERERQHRIEGAPLKIADGAREQHHEPDQTATAAIMIASWSTRPTAVMMESSENTMSMRMICG